MNRHFSWSRVLAVMIKEAIQLRRDRLTLAMIIGVPILQLILFGYAINTDPKQLPTAAIIVDEGPISRAIIAGLQLSNYFDIVAGAPSEAEAREMLARGDVTFIVTIPAGFERAADVMAMAVAHEDDEDRAARITNSGESWRVLLPGDRDYDSAPAQEMRAWVRWLPAGGAPEV